MYVFKMYILKMYVFEMYIFVKTLIEPFPLSTQTNANSQKCTQAYSPHPAHKFPEKSTWMSHSNESFHTFHKILRTPFLPVSIFFFSLEENLKIIKNLFFVFLTFNFCFSFLAPWGQILRIFKVSHLYVKKNLKWTKKISCW